MAYSEALQTVTAPAGADLSAKQYFIVKYNTAGAVVLCGAGELPAGILQNDPVSGEAAVVAIAGTSKVVTGGATTGGGPLMSDANGKAVNGTAGNKVVGQGRAASGGDGVIVPCDISRFELET